MPLYSYRCSVCGERVDVLRRMGMKDAGMPCPNCEGWCLPLFTTCHWNWGTAAASHGAFIEESGACGKRGVTWAGGKK